MQRKRLSRGPEAPPKYFDPINWLFSIDWTDANLRWVLTGTTLLGVAASTLGCFAFLRGRSLMGDALAHPALPDVCAALPGVCAAFIFGQWLNARFNLAIDPKHCHASSALRATLRELQRRNWVESSTSTPQSTLVWKLTPPGLQEAYAVVRKHRLWETFLMYETALGASRVHRDADTVEHLLPPETIAQLETMMRDNGIEPRLKPLEGQAV